MKNQEFKALLIRTAVMAMASDGSIENSEITELNNIVSNEVYFLDFEYDEILNSYIEDIKQHGNSAINKYIQEISTYELTQKQELLIIEVLLRIIQADENVADSELKFLQLVKSKLKTDEQTLIINFPNNINQLIDFNNYGLHKEFTDEIKLN